MCHKVTEIQIILTHFTVFCFVLHIFQFEREGWSDHSKAALLYEHLFMLVFLISTYGQGNTISLASSINTHTFMHAYTNALPNPYYYAITVIYDL